MTETPVGGPEATPICARPGCGNLIPPRPPGKTGPPRRFCSDACRVATYNAARPTRSTAAAAPDPAVGSPEDPVDPAVELADLLRRA
ncbi:hypothetical protein TR74_08580, partial [Carbonactinospora thermoautotrophica]